MNFKKVVRIGTFRTWGGKQGSTFCEISYIDGKLSISGVEGPLKSGNCLGSCGQIQDDIVIKDFAPGWNQQMLDEFINVWNKWHLNDMRAGCEHQRAEKWGEEEITVVEYSLNTDIWQEQNKVKEKSIEILTKNKKAEISDWEHKILNMPPSIKLPDYEQPPKDYTERSRKTKLSRWFCEKEHPKGVLKKPCPVCGYKYGSKWLYEEVPKEVLDFLLSLPHSDVTPHWV